MSVVSRPNLGQPPEAYEREYFLRLVNEITRLTEELNSVKRGYFTGVNLSALPTSAIGLIPGDMYNNAGTVKIVRSMPAWVGGSSTGMSSTAGTIVVSVV